MAIGCHHDIRDALIHLWVNSVAKPDLGLSEPDLTQVLSEIRGTVERLEAHLPRLGDSAPYSKLVDAIRAHVLQEPVRTARPDLNESTGVVAPRPLVGPPAPLVTL